MSVRRFWHWIWLLSALAGPALAAAQQTPFTIDQVMSAPFPSDLVASTTGGKVAWVFDARGVRNIWVASPPDYKPQPVTSYAEDDGQEIDELAWTPDARAIVYARGGVILRRSAKRRIRAVLRKALSRIFGW